MLLRRHLIAFAVLFAARPAWTRDTSRTSKMTVATASGTHKFSIELATTEAQMEQGLMFRRYLAPDAGMLFDFKRPIAAQMWMKNTPIPLDMLFLDAGGKVVDLHERAVPYSLDVIASKAPARFVIELNGGTVARLGISVGDRVTSPYFATAP
jgi:uncharacterized protein